MSSGSGSFRSERSRSESFSRQSSSSQNESTRSPSGSFPRKQRSLSNEVYRKKSTRNINIRDRPKECECGPNIYGAFLGPTLDENLLAGLSALFKVSNNCPDENSTANGNTERSHDTNHDPDDTLYNNFKDASSTVSNPSLVERSMSAAAEYYSIGSSTDEQPTQERSVDTDMSQNAHSQTEQKKFSDWKVGPTRHHLETQTSNQHKLDHKSSHHKSKHRSLHDTKSQHSDKHHQSRHGKKDHSKSPHSGHHTPKHRSPYSTRSASSGKEHASQYQDSGHHTPKHHSSHRTSSKKDHEKKFYTSKTNTYVGDHEEHYLAQKCRSCCAMTEHIIKDHNLEHSRSHHSGHRISKHNKGEHHSRHHAAVQHSGHRDSKHHASEQFPAHHILKHNASHHNSKHSTRQHAGKHESSKHVGGHHSEYSNKPTSTLLTTGSNTEDSFSNGSADSQNSISKSTSTSSADRFSNDISTQSMESKAKVIKLKDCGCGEDNEPTNHIKDSSTSCTCVQTTLTKSSCVCQCNPTNQSSASSPCIPTCLKYKNSKKDCKKKSVSCKCESSKNVAFNTNNLGCRKINPCCCTTSETSETAGDKMDGETRYAITKITRFSGYTTFEVMKSTKKLPKMIPTKIEGVFVLKNKKCYN